MLASGKLLWFQLLIIPDANVFQISKMIVKISFSKRKENWLFKAKLKSRVSAITRSTSAWYGKVMGSMLGRGKTKPGPNAFC